MIETLQQAFEEEPERKCFRQIGGILVERTVREVLPELQSHLTTVSVLLLFICEDAMRENELINEDGEVF